MNHTTSVQLARAAAIDKALTRRGWVHRREANDAHPGAIAATTYTRLGTRVLVLTLGGHHGQMIEITTEATTGQRRESGRRVRDMKPSWRLTAYDPPTDALLAAAIAAIGDSSEPLELAGWTVEHALARKVNSGASSYTSDAAVPLGAKVRATRFTRPDGAVTATFHVPTYTPPCEHCTHHGELGDTGGWIITGPRFTAEATAHTPTAVIGSIIRTPHGNRQGQPTPTLEAPPVEPRDRAKSIPTAESIRGARPIAVVC